MSKAHTFHIPVMGIGFTIDTPLKVSHLGINSVISLVDDMLLEKLRKMYCDQFDIPYEEITDKALDPRAQRITSYLNLIKNLAEKKFEEIRNDTFESCKELRDYFSMLPDSSELKKEFRQLTEKYLNKFEIKKWLKDNLTMGSIDVNIMTKVDKDNYKNKEKLPVIYNDAHAALRGFAESDLASSIIFSAGMNPRLYTYLENFDDFYPDETGYIKKKIVLKVSDYRSALIQGKFLAKKGLWVSEYRIESGLNCGGHAFATDGFLMGPILEEFKNQRADLVAATHELLTKALSDKQKHVPNEPLPIMITAQGGVGTQEEHRFLLDHYEVDSVGWGTPFLLVPEATTVDQQTIDQLIEAKEEDLYLSGISPLGVPFNTLKGNTKDIEKEALIAKGRPGSACPKKYVELNNEFNGKPICTASRQYQHLKIKALDTENLTDEAYRLRYEKIVEKSCICVGLGTSALLNYDLDTKLEGPGVSVCPGPNMAYFSKTLSLNEMVDHIYGRGNVISRTDRPHMFIKELGLYIDYLRGLIDDPGEELNDKRHNYLLTFSNNLKEGIAYYKELFSSDDFNSHETQPLVMEHLQIHAARLNDLHLEIENRATLKV